ncbi:MAG TPA: DUF5309 family protein [Patescibacteria group bacterium]|nr:DUF5309 family protein [Patescibacteria group bacterium]
MQIGARSTFNDTVSPRIDLSDMLPLITTPADVPLWTRLSHKRPTVNAVKHEWLVDTLPASADQLNEPGNVLAGDGTIDVDDGTKFKAGYVIKVDSELMRVTSVAVNVLTVSRGYAGSVAAGHNDNAAVDIVGYAVTDGADPADFATTDRVNRDNLHQVFQEKIEVTDLNEWAQAYGVHDKWGYEVRKWLKVLAIRAEKSILHGRKATDNTNKTRTMDGLLNMITTNATNVAGALTETVINNELQDIYDKGGDCDVIVLPPKQKRVLSGLMASTQRYYPRPTSSEALGTSVTRYISDFGEHDVLMDRHLPTDTALFLDTSVISIIDGQPFTLEPLAKTGTSRKGQIVGWFTLEVRAEEWNSKATGLT